MPDVTQTARNEADTGSDIIARLDHMDEQLHRLTRFLDKWEPVLERMKLPGWLGGRHHG